MGIGSALRKAACVTLVCMAAALFAMPPGGYDGQFVRTTLEKDNGVVQISRLVEQKSNDSAVKNFARQTIGGENAIASRLKPLARQMNITPPTQVTAGDRALDRKMQAMSGKKLDNEYIKEIIRIDKRDVMSLQEEAKKGTDPNVKQLARQSIGKLEANLSLARQLASKNNVKAPSAY